MERLVLPGLVFMVIFLALPYQTEASVCLSPIDKYGHLRDSKFGLSCIKSCMNPQCILKCVRERCTSIKGFKQQDGTDGSPYDFLRCPDMACLESKLGKIDCLTGCMNGECNRGCCVFFGNKAEGCGMDGLKSACVLKDYNGKETKENGALSLTARGHTFINQLS